jgi:Fur family peroxide stress response transcriptional regulator
MKSSQNLLKNSPLKVTPQRLEILQTIQKNGHISIDDLYNHIKEKFPSISLATVYKNIHTLKDEGILLEIHPQNEKPHFEIKKAPHGHFICKKCGKIYDFEVKTSCNPHLSEISEIDESEVYLYGVCKNCN